MNRCNRAVRLKDVIELSILRLFRFLKYEIKWSMPWLERH